MKKILILLALFTLVIAGTAFAADNVKITKHNLSSTGGPAYKFSNTAEVCVFCHTPHKANIAAGPLWNKGTPAGPYTPYTSATIDMTIGNPPGPVSLACLSCHDGANAMDVLVNAPGSGGYTAGGADAGYIPSGTILFDKIQAGITKIGPDLTTEHPVGVTYDKTKDTAFNAAVSGKVGTLPLYGALKDQVECGSCHNPHEATLPTFYRATNAASAMCTTCHIK